LTTLAPGTSALLSFLQCWLLLLSVVLMVLLCCPCSTFLPAGHLHARLYVLLLLLLLAPAAHLQLQS
jgi:hypothetical protein